MRASCPATALAVLATLVTFACSVPPNQVEDLPIELQQSSVVSVHDASTPTPETGAYTWMPGSEVVVPAASDAAALDVQLRAALQDSLLRRGFFLAPDGKGDYWVGYALVIEGALHDAQLDRKYGLHGDLEPTRDRRYERGALVLDVVDRRQKRGVWRGSIEALVDPTLSEELRRERLRLGVERLLTRFKQGY
jgi:hypothetical protein